MGLHISGISGSLPLVEMISGDLKVRESLALVYYLGDPGQMIQSGGAIETEILVLSQGGSTYGNYQFSGGEIDTGILLVGYRSEGYFTQTGGQLTVLLSA